LSPILLKILPKDLALEFNKEFHDTKHSVQDIISFLHKQLISRENLMTSGSDDYSFRDAKNFSPAYASDGAKKFPPHTHRMDNRQNRKEDFSPRGNKFYTQNRKLPTACDLLNENKSERCNFCLESSHLSNKCVKTRNLPFDERVNLLRKKGLCYLCLAPSHLARDCLSKALCKLCNRKHAEIMCNKDKDLKGEMGNDEKYDQSKPALSNHSLRANVYLQTLIVRISNHNNSKSSFIRLIIDSGSHNSYISKFAVDKLRLKSVNKETIKHGLLGGDGNVG
jgi:hypothetical protein